MIVPWLYDTPGAQAMEEAMTDYLRKGEFIKKNPRPKPSLLQRLRWWFTVKREPASIVTEYLTEEQYKARYANPNRKAFAPPFEVKK